MSSSVSATFSLELHARRWQSALAGAAVAACALVPWCLQDVPFWLQCAASASGAIASYIGFVCAGWLTNGTTVVRLARVTMDDWHLEDNAGRSMHTRLQPQTRFFRLFVWLQFESRHRVLLGPGDVAPHDFRRLQVILRQHRSLPHREPVA
ncbi:MAG: hypothetical protein ABW034_12580 [Steroidobacteraceae bacterium]